MRQWSNACSERTRSMRTSRVQWPYPAGGAQTLSTVFGLMLPVCSDTPNVAVDFDTLRPGAGASQSTPKRGKGKIHSTPARVNQYVAGIRSPATAWPRRTSVPAQSLSMGTPFHGHGWWYRLGCRIPTYLLGVWGREPPDELRLDTYE